jgi:vacuolar-type H+-ATPase catalytic subunit A/Vma1
MDDLNEKVKIVMRRVSRDGTSCTKTHIRLKYDYSLEDHLREYDYNTSDTIDSLLDQLACMAPTDLQKMIDRMDCERHLQLQKLLSAWTCEYSTNHPELEDEEGEDYGF